MSVIEQAEDGREALLEAVDGRECEYCDGGTVEIGTYKDNRAAVCEECGSPVVQLY
ncbi:HVO_A0556 family zinc finger protein [Halegenticoccus soli]|uniref:HVO_A0556 family zinc finger protein n=1 Tax=Halegenticoccus soli TaxID=1985678 RepID=UPI0018ED8E64|nr:HVO_A0556 family zinc finger protein [Halegenticoccus soli]